jgi:hypothetical protein
MKNGLKLATTVALAVLAVASASLPANAFDWVSILQSLSHGVSGWTELDARQNEISTQLAAAASSGQLTATEAESFRFELNRNMQVEAQIKASGRQLSATDSISFTNSLNNLTNRINMAILSKNTSTAASLAAVDALRAQLNVQITDARNARTMTRTDFEILKRDLEHNANIQSAFTASGDAISAHQAQVLTDDLARIRAAIYQNTTVAQAGVRQLTSQRTLIEQRITTGIAGRTIPDYQAADFRKEIDRIAGMQANFLSFDGVLNANEVLAIAGELDRLSSRVDYQISMGTNGNAGNTSRGNGWGNGYGRNSRRNEHAIKEIDDRRAQLVVRINTAQNTRKLSRFDASKLRRDLDRIAQNQAQLKLSGGGRLNYDQSTKIWTDLTNLQQLLDTKLATRASGSTSYRQY